MRNAWMPCWPIWRSPSKAATTRPKLMSGSGRDDVHLLVVCTADRGLCGGFNNSIVKLAKERVRRLQADGKEVKILCVGKKGFDILRRDYGKLVVDTISLRDVKKLGFGHADEIGKRLLAMFEAGEFDVCSLFYAAFQSVILQVPSEQQLIPASVQKGAEPIDLGGSIYEYEPEESEILQDLLPRNVSVQIFRALLENAASEQGARMSAMDNATRNAGEMIDKLTTSYNRQRQAQITTELIEIIAGAEAL